MSATRRRRAGAGCCADCCAHASSSTAASASPPTRANRFTAVDEWSDSSAGGSRPAAWPALTPSARRHTMSNANPNGPRNRDIGQPGSLDTGETLMSYDKNLAVAADTYFYFYAGSDKNTLLISNGDKIAPSANTPTPSRAHLSAIRRRIAAGTGYRTYFEHFLSVRLCRSCQMHWGSRLCLIPDCESRIKTDEPEIRQSRPKSSLYGSERSLRTDLSWIPSIVDFSSFPPSVCPSPSNPSSAGSSPSTISLALLAHGFDPTVNPLGEEQVICSLLDQFYSNQSKDHPHIVGKQQNKQNAILYNKQNVQQCQQTKISTQKRRAIFCPILTTNTCKGRQVAAQHCCGCHNFACTTYPDQLAFVRAADDAAAAYTTRIAQLLSAYRCDDRNDDENEFGEDEDEDKNDNEHDNNASMTNNSAQSNAHADPRLPLNASAAATRIERECLQRYSHEPAFIRPGLSSRLHVYNPHPARDYCRAVSCLFCTFKRERAPEDETAMRTLRARVAHVRRALAASDERGTIVQSEFITADGNVTTASAVISAAVTHTSETTITETTDGSITTDGGKNNFCASSVASAILSIPLAVIEEKISKLLKRFCDDPEEPNTDERCNACCTRRASVRAYPCGHQVLCRMCSVTVIKKIFEKNDDMMRCVLCRRQIAVLRHHRSSRNFAKHLIRPLYIADERRSKHAISPTPNKAARSSPPTTIAPV